MWLSLTPRPPHLNQSLLGWDKFQHAVAYGVFTVLAGSTFKSVPHRSVGRYPWRWALLIAIGFGALIEVLQGVMALGRTAEIADLLADGCGAGVVYCFAGYRERSRERNTGVDRC